MGKKQHQQDKLYLTSTEWKHFYGGKKEDTSSNKDLSDFRRLPFYCCCLSFQPFKHPYCSPDGIIFDLENIIPFLKKYGKNPVNGEPLEFKQLIKLNFYKNSKNEYHCPVTYKVFNENTVIAAIKTTGNVFSYDAIEELNIKANYYKDLSSDEPFVRKDIIKLQDPLDLNKFNIQAFHHLKKNLKWDDVEEKFIEERKTDPNFYLRMLNTEAKQTLEELNKTYVQPNKAKSTLKSTDDDDSKADIVNAASYSTGRVAASLTSTVAEVTTQQEAAKLDENEVRWARVIKKHKKGYVCLVTNLGRINIELFCDQTPRTCENFLKHCANKYYKDTKFHRLIKNFMIQGGDPTSRDGPATGLGGESIWGEPFEDEFKPNLTHEGRGILSMANAGPKTNKSQFFITLKSCHHLDNVHTVFGKVVGGLDVLNKMENVPTDKKCRPKEPIVIEDCLIFADPYIEVDDEIKEEREKEKQEKLAKLRKEKPVEPKNTLDTLKAQREGVGKYLSLEPAKRPKSVIDAAQEEEEKIKKFKAAMGTQQITKSSSSSDKKYNFGNFSNW